MFVFVIFKNLSEKKNTFCSLTPTVCWRIAIKPSSSTTLVRVYLIDVGLDQSQASSANIH